MNARLLIRRKIQCRYQHLDLSFYFILLLLFVPQVKAFLRGEALPFSAGELEGMACVVNMHVRVAKKLQNNSLRYWLLEYLRRQQTDRRFCALILKFIKHRTAALLLMEVILCLLVVNFTLCTCF